MSWQSDKRKVSAHTNSIMCVIVPCSTVRVSVFLWKVIV